MSYAVRKKLDMRLFYTVVLTFTFSLSSNIFLEKPQRVTEAQLDQFVQKWETAFSWNFWTVFRFTCCYDGAQHGASMIVQCCGVPIRSYNFEYVENIKKYWSMSTGTYYFMTPLVYAKPSPYVITINEFCDLILYKKVIFYTGAGISAGQVATMKELEQSLAISKSANFFKKIFLKPQQITKAFEQFCNTTMYGTPTPAHYALHQIAQEKSCCIVTENVDLLQQRAGSKPLFTHGPELKDVAYEDLLDIDAIICIGLSRDDRGFLAWYKANNHGGSLIAINKEMPNYLASEDYFVQGDLQEIVSYIEQKTCSR